MVDEVKLDKMSAYFSTPKPEAKNKQAQGDAPIEDAVTVTNHLNEWVKLVNTYDEPKNSAAISNIKHQIENNTYRIDFDKLSEKLLKSGVLTGIGD